MGDMTADPKDLVMKLFENFAQAPACKCTLQAFNVMCAQLGLDPLEHTTFYSSLKDKMTTWKAKALWSKLDKRFAHKEYKKGQACVGTKCLVIGGGPCGLRTAIELALMGAKVVVIEKRDSFSRNNVLHLWPFTIHDLRGLGAKKFYGKFCAGAIDHISIQQLQLMLLKIALIVGVEFHINVEFVKLLEPSEDQENEASGWRAGILPADHPVANFEFDVVVGADGRRNTLEGFSRTEFRGKLAIAITANFTNRNTTAEAKVEEISGLAFIFNQKFFLDLKEETGIDLENIVYYKDKTHYFVMTAKKQSLLDKGVVIHDYVDTQSLLCSNNVNQEALLCYAREAADFGTNYQLPTLDYATNHYGQPDVAMFDFTSMHASEHAAVVRERHGRHLLVALVGDSLLEPFWPMGTGCARGFLAALDTAWMVRGWAQERPVLELLAERESIYRLLPQTTPENLAKNFDLYTIDPGSRYPNKNFSSVKAKQVRHLYVTRELNACPLQRSATIRRPVNIDRRESEIRPGRLLTWCQKQTEGYRNVSVTDLTSSWRSGLALCALIHRFNSQLVDFSSLTEEDAAANLQLAFDVGQREFGVAPFTSGQELSAAPDVDKTQMILYLSKFYELFRGTPLPQTGLRVADENSVEYPSNDPRHMTNGINVSQPRKRVPREERKSEGTPESVYKRRRKGGSSSHLEEGTHLQASRDSSALLEETAPRENNRVRSMATQLQAMFEGTAASTVRRHTLQSFTHYPGMTEDPCSESRVSAPPKPSLKFKNFDKGLPEYAALQPPKVPPKPRSRVTQTLPHSEHPSDATPLQQRPLWEGRRAEQSAQTQTRAQTPTARRCAEAEYADLPSSPSPPSNHSAVLVMRRMLLRLREVEEHISEKKAQTQHAREFQKKSIKDKAHHLCDLLDATNVPKGSVHQTSPQSTDKCHSCGKRVYVVERISTEGLYFHRECFRCKTCNSPLSQGAHVYDSEQGKLYCKAHFVQHKNGTHLRRNINGRTGSCDRRDSVEPTSCSTSPERPPHCPTDAKMSPSPTGTLTSLLRKGLSWPMSLTHAVCGAPRQLSGWLQRRTRALGVHVRANGRDYAFLYELLSVGLPLLLVLQGVLQQMYVEAAPAVALCLQPALRWLEENAGLRLT
ncbi:F-actin-monooxygenase MICAL2 isoform X1 [Gadus chalcogrammus]|uniref:F-actin-monooxygenase MICAL2 isoform X1 n=1 Tax=Gadus chalcogrammus TaxID=1042646 RepID=UPI0024C477CC|nr:F-actin-monooxygenase MICAL2 isoform X1 [Gadus chalcogrammus]XP_056463073.1 F-actin-monooxygenase MICAL2 isoform X1 [Gadus chalcogrammus]